MITKVFQAKVTSNLAGSYFGLISGNLGRFMQTMAKENPEFEIKWSTMANRACW
jgi:putative aldouronate transport system substrate-binding protein